MGAEGTEQTNATVHAPCVVRATDWRVEASVVCCGRRWKGARGNRSQRSEWHGTIGAARTSTDGKHRDEV